MREQLHGLSGERSAVSGERGSVRGPLSFSRHQSVRPLTAHRLLLTAHWDRELPRPRGHRRLLRAHARHRRLGSRHQATAATISSARGTFPPGPCCSRSLSTETSALTVISVPGIGARGDLTFLQLAFGYVVGRIGVAVWLLPGYFTGKQETAYARLESRFGAGTRRLLSMVFLVTRFLGDGVRIFAGAIPLALVTGWSIPASIVAMGLVTLVYTFFGGLKAVVWADVLQLAVYIAGGVAALVVAWSSPAGPGVAFSAAAAAGKLRMIDPTPSLTVPYTLLGGLIGGAMLSAASHGTDHLIVQRLLATRSLRAARVALVGSGVVVFFQFLLFLLVGTAIWSAGLAPRELPADEIFTGFVIEHLPVGLVGLVIAGILAAAMSSSISALASSVTHDLYASWTGRTDPTHLPGGSRVLRRLGHRADPRGARLPLHRRGPEYAGRRARPLDRLDDVRRAARRVPARRASRRPGDRRAPPRW